MYSLSPEQMYNIVSGADNEFGIPGYICWKKYFDYKQQLWVKKREEILTKHRKEWPPQDWPKDKESDKQKPPHRWNFIDDQIKWANSFNDQKKSDEIKQNLEDKGKKVPAEPQPFKSDFDKKKNQKNLIAEFKQREEELKKIREQINSLPEFKQEAISQVEEKIKNGNTYQPRKGYSNWAKNERIMYSSDGEYLAEQYPFWNPNPKEEDKRKAEFFPNKIKLMKRYPIWSIGPKKSDAEKADPLQYIKARDEKIEEKISAAREKLGIDKNKFLDDAVLSYDKVHSHGRLPMVIKKPFDYKATDQYKTAMENKKVETPAPNTYWDDGKAIMKMRLNVEEDAAKRYVNTREQTFKRVYKSGMHKYVF